MSTVSISGGILDTSIWGEDPCTRVVWLTMLMMANDTGMVAATDEGIFRRAAVDPEEGRDALQVLDTDRGCENGRGNPYIERVHGGWQIRGDVSYRGVRTDVQRKAAERQRKHRAKKKATDGRA